jgi:hypothetical protein
LRSDVHDHGQRLLDLENRMHGRNHNDAISMMRDDVARCQLRLDQNNATIAKMREAWSVMAMHIAKVEAQVKVAKIPGGP